MNGDSRESDLHEIAVGDFLMAYDRTKAYILIHSKPVITITLY